MKKIFLFLVALVGIVACSKGDSGSSEDGGNSGGESVTGYNPPSWIIGTWMDESNSTGFKFTSKDLTTRQKLINIDFKTVNSRN